VYNEWRAMMTCSSTTLNRNRNRPKLTMAYHAAALHEACEVQECASLYENSVNVYEISQTFKMS